MKLDVRKKGYEYNGWKLGWNTNEGKIIGFCVGDDFIVIRSDKFEKQNTIENDRLVFCVLDGYENCYEYKIFNEHYLEVIPTELELKNANIDMNIINDNGLEYLKLTYLYNKKEWEWRISKLKGKLKWEYINKYEELEEEFCPKLELPPPLRSTIFKIVDNYRNYKGDVYVY